MSRPSGGYRITPVDTSVPAGDHDTLTGTEATIPDEHRTTLVLGYPGPQTTKSQYHQPAEQPATT